MLAVDSQMRPWRRREAAKYARVTRNNPAKGFIVSRLRKWLTLADLRKIAELGPDWDYNAQLDPAEVEAASEDRFAVRVAFSHGYKQGQPCEPHMRCGIILNGRIQMYQWNFGTVCQQSHRNCVGQRLANSQMYKAKGGSVFIARALSGGTEFRNSRSNNSLWLRARPGGPENGTENERANIRRGDLSIWQMAD
jgi:hypothetical protein